MKKHILPTAFILSAAAAIACASRPFDSHAPAASALPAARTVIAPAVGMTNQAAGASLSNSTSQIGGDISPSHQKVEQEAQAPAGEPAPAGASFDDVESMGIPHTLVASALPPNNLEVTSTCHCGPSCPCQLFKNTPDFEKSQSKISAALAQPPAPAVPVPAAPVAAAYTPAYPTYRPTFTGYYYGSCGPGVCGPVRWRRWGR